MFMFMLLFKFTSAVDNLLLSMYTSTKLQHTFVSRHYSHSFHHAKNTPNWAHGRKPCTQQIY